MYNDENNLYHYTYRKDGTEPGQRYDAKQPSVDDQINSYRHADYFSPFQRFFINPKQSEKFNPISYDQLCDNDQ